MNKALLVIFAAVGLDAMGIGLIFPVLPRLLQSVTGASNVAVYIGATTALYAGLQFVFAPALGALSDSVGRRPMLLISIAGAAINYLAMTFASSLAMLLIGRAISGLTSANVAVATAYLTDVTPPDQHARRFGQFNAMFGLGFIVGPILGGVLSDYDLRLPFLAAAALNAANFLLAWLLLPEGRPQAPRRIGLAALNPLQPLRWVLDHERLVPILLVFFMLSAAGEAYGACWALWGYDAFKWNGFGVGLSLGAFGVCHTLAQALLPGPATRIFGERATVVFGVASASVALIALAFAKSGWIVFAIMPIFALEGLGAPAFQTLATRQVDAGRQGQLQGAVASAMSLASVIGPIAFSSLYFVARERWPGAIWLAVVVIYAMAGLLALGSDGGRAKEQTFRQ